MANSETHAHQPPQVNIANREAMFNRFLKFCGWTGLHILLVTGYLTLVFAITMNWLVALILMLLAGIIGGWLLKLGSAWYLSLVAQVAIVLMARLSILIFVALI